MFHRYAPRSVLIAMLLLLAALPALAGGWAVVTLDELPTQVVAGQPLTIGFVVRQHGHRPMDGLTPRITASHAESNESINVTARQEGPVGHYVATLTFPSAGVWRWGIDAFTFEQPMPVLTVLATTTAANDATGAPVSAWPSLAISGRPLSVPLAAGVLGLIGTAGALVVSLRRRPRFAPALVLIAAAVSLAGFASAGNRPTLSAPEVAQPGPSALDQGARGRDLFLAKGCVVCHQHAAVAEARQALGSFSVGPVLTNLSADPEFLRRWLKNPVAIRPTTQMPTLGLSDQEIEALVAFLTAGRSQK
ncbi:MAG: c-type cytochrome [Ardenticatenaceae bacterium]|nr:c-type cytochrome [Ardenticatenaceae bacterium]